MIKNPITINKTRLDGISPILREELAKLTRETLLNYIAIKTDLYTKTEKLGEAIKSRNTTMEESLRKQLETLKKKYNEIPIIIREANVNDLSFWYSNKYN
jgi:flagellar capping protein FliD